MDEMVQNEGNEEKKEGSSSLLIIFIVCDHLPP
jgi:hypothetical protein